MGGKSPAGSGGIGRWIAGLLPPPDPEGIYIEPFAGMCGVLRQRGISGREVISDMDEDLMNWWRTVRDFPKELGELLDWTPGWSPVMFDEAVAGLDHPDPIRRAYHFTLAVNWVRGNIPGVLRRGGGGIKRKVVGRDGNISPPDPRLPRYPALRGRSGEMSPPRSGDVYRLNRRVAEVEMEVMEAGEMVERHRRERRAVFYLDPPYPTASGGELYAHNRIDAPRLSALLGEVAGRAAISGYGDEWAALEERGWVRNELETHAVAGSMSSSLRPRRTEVLWTNYRPVEQGKAAALF